MGKFMYIVSREWYNSFADSWISHEDGEKFTTLYKAELYANCISNDDDNERIIITKYMDDDLVNAWVYGSNEEEIVCL